MMYNIENRRYIGNKFKLLNFINYVLEQEKPKFDSICDLFAGTGIVSKYFLKKIKML